VGSVRWLQQRIGSLEAGSINWSGKRIGVVSGSAMARLMPLVLEPLERVTGAFFDLIPVVNSLFGPSVTTAGLLPGAAVEEALRHRADLDLVLLPGESLNDDELFIDSMSLERLQTSIPVEALPSKDFADVLGEPVRV
jgi:NifB/MoaA-like Fe-S oxidoreductase